MRVSLSTSVRSIVYRFQDLDRLETLLESARTDLLLRLPKGEEIGDGEWVLAIFEVGSGRRATAAAARGTRMDDGSRLLFESRDFQRVRDFVKAAKRSGGSGTMQAVKPVQAPAPPSTPPPDTARSVPNFTAPPPPAETAPFPAVHDSGKFPAGIGAGSRVLMVDDDPDIREVVGAMLEAVGLVVETCSDAEEAVTRSCEKDFDLLVVDWNLPGMNGLDLCRAVRKNAKTATIPVLFLSANASSHDMVEAFASGADDYVVKPFRAPELGARIFGLLRRARMAGHGPVRISTT
jgi:two-component system, OmpR family, phosphate regulon response regulator PhoB